MESVVGLRSIKLKEYDPFLRYLPGQRNFGAMNPKIPYESPTSATYSLPVEVRTRDDSSTISTNKKLVSCYESIGQSSDEIDTVHTHYIGSSTDTHKYNVPLTKVPDVVLSPISNTRSEIKHRLHLATSPNNALYEHDSTVSETKLFAPSPLVCTAPDTHLPILNESKIYPTPPHFPDDCSSSSSGSSDGFSLSAMDCELVFSNLMNAKTSRSQQIGLL